MNLQLDWVVHLLAGAGYYWHHSGPYSSLSELVGWTQILTLQHLHFLCSVSLLPEKDPCGLLPAKLSHHPTAVHFVHEKRKGASAERGFSFKPLCKYH